MKQDKKTLNTSLNELLAEAKAIKSALKYGAPLTYEQAKTKVTPLLEQVNSVGRKIAKKYNRKYREIKFTDL